MHPHSTDGRALGLHSCRALSSLPYEYLKSETKIFEAAFDKPHTCDPWLKILRFALSIRQPFVLFASFC